MSLPLGYRGSVVSIGFHLCWVVVLGDLSLVCPELAGVGEIFLGRGLVFPALTVNGGGVLPRRRRVSRYSLSPCGVGLWVFGVFGGLEELGATGLGVVSALLSVVVMGRLFL